jgi:A118 family predicted phage portal protein
VPLPASDQDWPPAPLTGISTHLTQWSAWLAGDVAALNAAYQQADRPQIDRPAQYRGGLQGAAARAFYGRPVGDLTRPRRQLHVPIAADLCQASADLLFAEPPTFTVEQAAAQDRLNQLSDDGLHTVLAEAAEVGAALGGVYLRTSWDPATVPGRPFLTTVHADAAWPEFRWGNLVAVTFWWVVGRNGQQVLRHLERHELDGDRNGLVLHGLYQGDEQHLGRPIPLTEHPATTGLSTEVDEDGALIEGRTPGLCVTYVPNQRPQRRWRNHPLGANLGRSDLDGIEPLMERLDATWTSWMRDIDLGRARLIVSQSMLENHGPGGGASFDLDQEVFTPLNMPPGSIASGAGAGITPSQFAIRVDEHSRTCSELLAQILRSAGYSAQTFGEGGDGIAATATEVDSRNQRSFTTRDRKIRLWRPATRQALTKLLSVDAEVFGRAYEPEGLTVAFPDSVQESPQQLAQTASLLRTAEAASTRTLVALAHPEWDDPQVDAEVTLIQAETGRAVPDPIGQGEFT